MKTSSECNASLDVKNNLSAFWNKYNNLVFLKDQLELAKKYNFIVPDFFWINTEMYDLYIKTKNNQEFKQALLSFFNWEFTKKVQTFTNDKIILRSSCLYSEDSKDFFGAGLYDSIVISKTASFDEFYEAVTKVYESINNATAVKFRSSNNIKEEKMGIVIQEYYYPDTLDYSSNDNQYKWFINSIVKNAPKVVSISQNWGSIILDKDIVSKFSDEEVDSASYRSPELLLNKWILKIPFDTYRIWILEFVKMARIAIELSNSYGSQVQIEYVISNNKLYLVQIRPYPISWCTEEVVSFPTDKEQICEVDCAFVFPGKTLDVSFTDYVWKDRIRFEESSHMQSLMSSNEVDFFIECIPEVLFMETYANADHGHLESIVAERWGIIINAHNLDQESKNKLKKEKQLYVVSDWIKARIYKVNSDIVSLPLSNKRVESFFDSKMNGFFTEWQLEQIEYKAKLSDNFFLFLSSQFVKEFKLYKKTDMDFHTYFVNYVAKSPKYEVHFDENSDGEEELFILFSSALKKKK